MSLIRIMSFWFFHLTWFKVFPSQFLLLRSVFSWVKVATWSGGSVNPYFPLATWIIGLCQSEPSEPMWRVGYTIDANPGVILLCAANICPR